MERELELDLLAGVVKVGGEVVMTVKELLFLLGSARAYDESFSFDESRTFMQELRETVGTGFTKEQYETFMKEVKAFYGDTEDDTRG